MSAAEPTVWHALSADEAVDRLKSNLTTGLDEAEAARRQAEYGLNVLPTARKRGPLKGAQRIPQAEELAAAS